MITEFGLKEALVIDFVFCDTLTVIHNEKDKEFFGNNSKFYILQHTTEKTLGFFYTDSDISNKAKRMYFISGLTNTSNEGCTIYMKSYNEFKKFIRAQKMIFDSNEIKYNSQKIKDFYGEQG